MTPRLGPEGGTLLLHGTPLTPELWDGIVAELSVAEPTATILTPWVELSGEGGDEGDDGELADRIAGALPAGSEPWHVVGHSFGGQVAIDLALRHPELVAQLTLLCTRDTPFPAFATAAARLRDGLAPDVPGALSRWFRADELTRSEPIVAYARRCLIDADRMRWARALESIATFDRTDRLAAIAVPTHVVAAEFDQVSTVDAMAAMAARLPHSRFTVWPGAAHLSPFLRPAELAGWISGLSRSDA